MNRVEDDSEKARRALGLDPTQAWRGGIQSPVPPESHCITSKGYPRYVGNAPIGRGFPVNG